MRYKHGVSKVIMDALVRTRAAVRTRRRATAGSISARHRSPGLADHPLASTWNRLGTFIYRRGDEFYNFEGLRAFKQKFDPVWTPIFMACPNGLALPQVLFDVTNLISGNPIRILKK